MSIKYHISIFFILVMQISLIAQKDTSFQTIRQEIGEYQAPVIETPSDQLFRTKVPTRFAVKSDFAQYTKFYRNTFQSEAILQEIPSDIEFEYKCSQAFSVGAVLGYIGGNGFRNMFKSGWLISAEGRWYHDMKKRIKLGQSANNFGGKYLALETLVWGNRTSAELGDNRGISLRYGLQQRVLKYGYFDISLGAGIANSLEGNSDNPQSKKVFSIDQNVSFGLGLFDSGWKKEKKKVAMCDIIHCQDEQYSMLKINVFDVFEFLSNGSNYNVNFRPNIAFEQKIGRSPFSVEAELEGNYSDGNSQYLKAAFGALERVHLTSLSWDISTEIRWYYSMRNRILDGRSGNNLSGSFIGFQVSKNNLIENSIRVKTDNNSTFKGVVMGGNFWARHLIWGVQQRVLERGFIQFKIGAGITTGGNNYVYESADKPLRKRSKLNELDVMADLKVGFAF
jgi:hypothetical protein